MRNAMSSNEVEMQLHDRATRGEVLTSEEQRQLDSWYSLQDAQESKWLASTTPLPDTSQLRQQVEAVLSAVALTTQRMQQTTAENEALRHEISDLQQQLASVQSA